jgi:hypothetical protein
VGHAWIEKRSPRQNGTIFPNFFPSARGIVQNYPDRCRSVISGSSGTPNTTSIFPSSFFIPWQAV